MGTWVNGRASLWKKGGNCPGQLGVMAPALTFPVVFAAIGVLWDFTVFCLPEVPALPSHIQASRVCKGGETISCGQQIPGAHFAVFKVPL